MSLRVRTLQVIPKASPVEPCIPSEAPRPPSGPGWLHEIKWDGFRLMARRDAGGVRLITRNGHEWTDRYPWIAAAVDRLRCRSCLIDGEVVICGEDGRPDFERLQMGRRIKPEGQLYAFDLLEWNGTDLRRRPLIERKAKLAALLAGAPAAITYNEHLEGEGEAVFASACKLGLEGIVSKRADSSYRSGRSRDWLKCKSPAAKLIQAERSEKWNGA